MPILQLAFYKGPTSDVLHWIGHKAVCIYTRSIYSHIELIIDGVCHSASARDGGVRAKQIDLASGKWDVVTWTTTDEVVRRAKAFFEVTKGEQYDWLGVAWFVLPFIRHKLDYYFCSEWCAKALGLALPHKHSPQDLYDWAIEHV